MREWLVREKSGISSGKLKDAKEHFYPLLGDASPEGVKKRRQLWSDLQKEYPEAIISLFFFWGAGGTICIRRLLPEIVMLLWFYYP